MGVCLFSWEFSSSMFLAILWFNSCYSFIAASIVILYFSTLFWSVHFCEPSPSPSSESYFLLSSFPSELSRHFLTKSRKEDEDVRVADLQKQRLPGFFTRATIVDKSCHYGRSVLILPNLPSHSSTKTLP